MLKKTVLISGCSSGIGAELAQKFRSNGWYIVGVDIDPSGKTKVDAFLECDLGVASEVARLKDRLHQLGFSNIDVFVANAAIGLLGPIDELSDADIENLYQVNLFSNLSFIHSMKGRILQISFVSSVAVSKATPHYMYYTATKAALEGFAKSFEVEQEITTQILRVAPTRTSMHEKVGLKLSQFQMNFLYSPNTTATFLYNKIVAAKGGTHVMGALPKLQYLFSKLKSVISLLRPNIMCLPRLLRGPVLLTGSSKGIGKSICTQMLNQGIVVHGVSRETPSVLHATERHFQADLSQSNQISDLCAKFDNSFDFKMLIFNAGSSAVGSFYSVPLSEHDRVLRLNLVGPVLLLKKLLAAQLCSPDVRLVFINSLCFFTRYPGACSYAASKYGLAHVALSISKKFNVTSVFPGPTDTWHAENFSPGEEHGTSRSQRTSPDRVAAQIIEAIKSGRRMSALQTKTTLFALLGTMNSKLVGTQLKRILYDKLKNKVLLESK